MEECKQQKKEGRTTEDRGMNRKEPHTWPRRVSGERVSRDHGISKNRTLWFNVNEGLGWKENHGIQNTGIEDCNRNIIVDKVQVLKILKNYSTEI